jgi:mono/diheme cytochrome c family protein
MEIHSLTRNRAIGVISSVLVVSAVLVAQSASSTRDGVYTSDQADQGHTLYTKQCAMCHGDALEGGDPNPPLVGGQFLQNWTGQTLGDLSMKIQTTMPATQPGSLKPDEVAQVIAYILRENKFPAGKTALPQSMDQLNSIHIEAPLGGQ